VDCPISRRVVQLESFIRGGTVMFSDIFLTSPWTLTSQT